MTSSYERRRIAAMKLRGGARPGSGRKPIGITPSVAISVRVPPELRERLKAYVRRERITTREFVERALDALEKETAGSEPGR